MRLTALPRQPFLMPRSSSQPAPWAQPAGPRSIDAFERPPTALSPTLFSGRAASAHLPLRSSCLAELRWDGGAPAPAGRGRQGQEALEVTLNLLAEKLLGALKQFLAKLAFEPPAVPAPAPVPVGEALAPTPLAGEVPGQVAFVNTIQEPNIAPKSTFRNAVNAAIDAVRAKGIGIDPQDPDAITDYDTYHSGVVQELRARGYQAAYDGEELAVGRRGDGFSEQFDISTSTGRVRRFYASHLSPPVWA